MHDPVFVINTYGSVPQLIVPSELDSPDGTLSQRYRDARMHNRQPTGDPAPPNYDALMIVE